MELVISTIKGENKKTILSHFKLLEELTMEWKGKQKISHASLMFLHSTDLQSSFVFFN